MHQIRTSRMDLDPEMHLNTEMHQNPFKHKTILLKVASPKLLKVTFSKRAIRILFRATC